MAEKKTLRGKALRITKLDGCGDPVLGPDSVIKTKGFITVTMTPNTQTGTPIQVDNANGERIVDDTPTPKVTSWTVEFAFIGVSPSLLHLMTGAPLVYSADGTEVVGFRHDTAVDVELLGFAAEWWSGVYSEACAAAGVEYGYGLLPFLKGGSIGAVTVANDAINFTVTGAVTRDGSQWGAGPFDVVLDELGNPGPLNEAAVSSTHFHFEATTVAPPTDLDGEPEALGVPATGATAGTPGATTPANSYAPKDLAELQAGAGGDHGVDVVASPATAWTTGQRIVLRDGSTAHWDSDSWEAGPA